MIDPWDDEPRGEGLTQLLIDYLFVLLLAACILCVGLWMAAQERQEDFLREQEHSPKKSQGVIVSYGESTPLGKITHFPKKLKL